MSYRTATLAAIACSLAMIAAILSLTLAASSLASGTPVSVPARAHSTGVATLPCGSEDSPDWNWHRCGNHRRGVVTMWGTPKVVSCGALRWLVRHGDLDPHTPRLRGDRECGRR